jgi:hypothetical protein
MNGFADQQVIAGLAAIVVASVVSLRLLSS